MKLSEKLMEAFNLKPHPNSRVQKALTEAGVPMTAELGRILALPRRPAVFEEGKVEDLTSVYLREGMHCKGCPVCRLGSPRLWPIQSGMLWDAERQNGLFAPVAVGAGKTLTTLLLPDAMKSKRAVLLIKPNLREQFWGRDVPNYGRHFHIAKCWKIDARWKSEVKLFEGEADLFVVAYSELSSAKQADILDRIEPDLIIADEAHHLRNRTASRTKRFLRYMKEHPECRFVGLSGTMTKRSLYDFQHLIEQVCQ